VLWIKPFFFSKHVLAPTQIWISICTSPSCRCSWAQPCDPSCLLPEANSTRPPWICSVIFVTKRQSGARKPLTCSIVVSKQIWLWTLDLKKVWQREKGTYPCGNSSSVRNDIEYGIHVVFSHLFRMMIRCQNKSEKWLIHVVFFLFFSFDCYCGPTPFPPESPATWPVPLPCVHIGNTINDLLIR